MKGLEGAYEFHVARCRKMSKWRLIVNTIMSLPFYLLHCAIVQSVATVDVFVDREDV
jgi:hypothetical protein